MRGYLEGDGDGLQEGGVLWKITPDDERGEGVKIFQKRDDVIWECSLLTF